MVWGGISIYFIGSGFTSFRTWCEIHNCAKHQTYFESFTLIIPFFYPLRYTLILDTRALLKDLWPRPLLKYRLRHQPWPRSQPFCCSVAGNHFFIWQLVDQVRPTAKAHQDAETTKYGILVNFELSSLVPSHTLQHLCVRETFDCLFRMQENEGDNSSLVTFVELIDLVISSIHDF